MPWRRRPNIRKLARKHDAGRLVRALGYHDYMTDRLGRMYDLGAGVRRDAALALASVAGTDGVDVGAALIRSLSDSSGEVRRAAARSLGSRREIRAAPALAEAALARHEPRYAPAGTAAADALLDLSGPDSVRALVTVVVQRDADLTLAREILTKMVASGGSEAARCACVTAALALSEGDGEVSERAAEVLVWLGRDSVEALLGLLGSTNGARLASIRALGRLGDLRSSDALVALLCDDDTDVRRTAAIALGDIADARVTQPLLAATADSDHGVRRAALEAVQKLGGPGASTDLDPWSSASGVD